MRKLLFLLAVVVIAAPASACGESDVAISFRTPTGNIGCVFAHFAQNRPTLRCDIRSGLHNPKLPPTPSNCHLDFGQGLQMANQGAARIVCAGDTALDPHARPLAYGTSFVRDGFRCDSAFNGLTCKNLSSHGFFLNADVWRLF
jgi:uncharacterized protein DUF6636